MANTLCKLPQKPDSSKLDKIFNFKLYEKNEIHREPGHKGNQIK